MAHGEARERGELRATLGAVLSLGCLVQTIVVATVAAMDGACAPGQQRLATRPFLRAAREHR